MIDSANKVSLLRLIREQVKSDEGFSLNAPKRESVAPPLLQVAQADRPSASQKETACLSMLNEARATVDALHGSLSVMNPSDIERYRSDPDSMLMLTDRIDEASAKLATIKDQCGDVLPAGAMEELEELEKKLNDVRDLLFDKDVPGTDFLAIAGPILEGVRNSLGTVAAGFAGLMRLFFGPGLPQSDNGSGRREIA